MVWRDAPTQAICAPGLLSFLHCIRMKTTRLAISGLQPMLTNSREKLTLVLSHFAATLHLVPGLLAALNASIMGILNEKTKKIRPYMLLHSPRSNLSVSLAWTVNFSTNFSKEEASRMASARSTMNVGTLQNYTTLWIGPTNVFWNVLPQGEQVLLYIQKELANRLCQTLPFAKNANVI